MKMKTNDRKGVIAMPSLTNALRGESLLNAKGIYVRVIKLPAGSTKRGCAYGLEINRFFVESAVRDLETSGIQHGEILL